MGKSRTNRKGLSREQRLLQENAKLKREVGRLRKELARVDLDRYDSVKEAIDEYSHKLIPDTGKDVLEKMKEAWSCRKCSGGYLEIFVFNKVGSTYYFRKCSSCDNRTKSQRYTPEVKGIIKDTKI